MRLRLGLIVGFGAGYYLGSMAGRERYEQINRVVRKVKRSDAYDVATDKAKAVVDLGVERAKDVVEDKFKSDTGSNGGSSTPYTGTSTTGPGSTTTPGMTPQPPHGG